MTLVKHELKQGKPALLIWTAVIAFMLAVCILIYPEMETQMNGVSTMFAEMGTSSQPFTVVFHLKQAPRLNAESFCKDFDFIQSDIPPAAFDPADKGASR